MPILDVRDVSVVFRNHGAEFRAVDGVSLAVEAGEILAIVGESGCGKTTLARAILGLQPVASGEITLNGESVKGLSRDQAARIGMVWQDPNASLDPRWPIGRTILEAANLLRKPVDVDALMRSVGLDPTMAGRYPHELSGGQRQRVAIGRAIALQPPLVICDEPTAALDLSIQAQILNLLKDLQATQRCAYLYISHDLVTVRFLANRVAVMYKGKIVETGPTAEVFENPQDPYTRGLLEASPTLEKLGMMPTSV